MHRLLAEARRQRERLADEECPIGRSGPAERREDGAERGARVLVLVASRSETVAECRCASTLERPRSGTGTGTGTGTGGLDIVAR